MSQFNFNDLGLITPPETPSMSEVAPKKEDEDKSEDDGDDGDEKENNKQYRRSMFWRESRVSEPSTSILPSMFILSYILCLYLFTQNVHYGIFFNVQAHDGETVKKY
ncbi:hypothetical protein F5878DRAFT_641716 [Lentinula raphanica]|uniref:Uncharacterized protein n=1 Tax=Lentinula raphanica TaxID=153919 RepID=A0AA38UEL9_9AGAR|nr:hypothetical protein F5878DRAFT_641716 [Lentinula raphanica]